MTVGVQYLLLLLSAVEMTSPIKHASGSEVKPYQADGGCQKTNEVARWINEQIVQNAKVTRLNHQLGKILDSLSGNSSSTIDEKHCCFYEKNTMDRIFEVLTAVTKTDDLPLSSNLHKTGDLGKDLDNILNITKQVIGKNLQSCCDRLRHNLKQLEADVSNQLKTLEQKVRSDIKEQPNKAIDIKKKHNELELKLQELRHRIELLQSKQKDNEKAILDESCCKKLQAKQNELKEQLERAKTETQAQVKELEQDLNKQREHQNEQILKMKEMKAELENRAENNENVIQTCTKICINNDNDNETRYAQQDILKKIENMERSMQQISKDKSNDKEYCQKVENGLTEAEEKIKELRDLQATAADRSICESSDFKYEIEKAKICCKDIDKLAKAQDEFRKSLLQLNISYTRHISPLEDDLKNFENQLQINLNNLKTAENNNDRNKFEEIDNLIKQLQDKLNDKIQSNQQNLSDSDKKLKELQDAVNKKQKQLDELSGNLDKLDKASRDQEKRLNRLEEQQDDLSKDLARTLELEKRVEELEKQLKGLLEDNKLNQAEVDKCISNCEDLDKVKDLMGKLDSKKNKGDKDKDKGGEYENDKRKGRNPSMIGGVN